MSEDINANPFDDATKDKLDLFQNCFKEWFPTLLHNIYCEKLYVFDFFAGSGIDSDGNFGSPLILLKEAMGENRMHCSRDSAKKVKFVFNEIRKKKSELLNANVNSYIETCLDNCKLDQCVYDIKVKRNKFRDLFLAEDMNRILRDPKIAKFVLLDQYGFKEIDEQVFSKLVASPTTDFIFFITSSFLKRFQEHPYIQKYFESNRIDFNESEPKYCHSVVADYYRSLIPLSKEYFIHHFTIKKGSNYYGLIFGTNHSLGMEKFLKVCWEKDPQAGESNFYIHGDFDKSSLFYTENNTIKKEKYKSVLVHEILEGKVKNNKAGLHHALKNSMLPKVYVEVIEELSENNPRVKIIGKFNRKTTGIHKLKDSDIYTIEVIS
ncbi:three-Cys-motif partner protein TcmP [Leptospira paudalimensis]|uniref:Three-Cys-motif partner protein TcmP n=1 Tax=Leptospira paudalimensis TaxID=2950024 RepID=A0ABT3M4E8_9LEPT|nr:three-Cys-motif partner protein TcmP [Leptospira paudalimensis]MCW7503265.1 three-Cys-motif partner protein TcmP [Leptospira paudalimensis]